MIYMYMLIIWEMQTYPGAWALALMQTIYKGGGKDRYSPSSYRGIYLLNNLTKLSAQEWTNRTLITHERTSVHFLVLPGSLLSFTEITEYTYISLI